MMHLKEQRESLSEHLKDVPAFGDVDAGANYAAKLHQMERLLMEEKERWVAFPDRPPRFPSRLLVLHEELTEYFFLSFRSKLAGQVR